jgi:hypothetical protein
VNLAEGNGEPGLNDIGYVWAVRAIGTDGSKGLTGFERVIYVLPDTPVLTAPAHGAFNVPTNFVGTLKWNGAFSPSRYWIKIFVGAECAPNLPVFWKMQDASAGLDEVFGGPNPATMINDFPYSWKVRPRSWNATVDAKYHNETWSACHAFQTVAAPPPPPTLYSMTYPPGLVNAYVAFHTVDEADSYEVSYYPVTEDEQETPQGPTQSWPLDKDTLDDQTADFVLLTGATLPPDVRVTILDGAEPLGWHRMYVSACNSAGCTPSTWWIHHPSDP